MAQALHGYLGLGSNLGDRRAHLRRAIELLQADQRLKLIAQSRLYRSKPVGFASHNEFLNQVVEVEWEGPVTALLNLAGFVEHECRRYVESELAELAPGEHAGQPRWHDCVETLPDNLALFDSTTLCELDDELQTLRGGEAMFKRACEQLQSLHLSQRRAAAESDPVRRYFDRTIDVDLLCFGETVLSTTELTLPHPRAHLRAFVLLPLHELAPALLLKDRSLGEWIAELPVEQRGECSAVGE